MSSPIETLIDRALGVPKGWRPTHIVLRCPCCGSRTSAERSDDDPVAATQLDLYCPSCWPVGAETTIAVYRGSGGRIIKRLAYRLE